LLGGAKGALAMGNCSAVTMLAMPVRMLSVDLAIACGHAWGSI